MHNRVFHSTTCAACRLRSTIALQQLARTRGWRWTPLTTLESPLAGRSTRRKGFATSSAWRAGERSLDPVVEGGQERSVGSTSLEPGRGLAAETQDRGVEGDGAPTAEEAALWARMTFGDVLPDGVLGEEGLRVYERLYGKAVEGVGGSEIAEGESGVVEVGTGVLRDVEGGGLVEVGFEEVEEEDGVLQEMDIGLDRGRADARVAEDIFRAMKGETHEEDSRPFSPVEEEAAESHTRTHPLTAMNRFGTSPASLLLPRLALVEAIQLQLAGRSNTHLAQASERAFGGLGLPYSTSTPGIGRSLPSKPIGLEASQKRMSDIEGDVFLAALVPGMYASIMSVLVETRKRLGSAWAEELVRKAEKGDLRILDAGGAGAGVFAVREMLKASTLR